MARSDLELEAFEDELVEAMAMLLASPDQERGWLASGSRSWWPAIVRDPVTDYPGEETPRRQMSRRDVDLLERLFTGARALCLVVPVERRALLGCVLALKARPERGGFRWSRVWERMGGKACGATTDGLRSRYETQVRRMWSAGASAAVWERMRAAVVAGEQVAIGAVGA